MSKWVLTISCITLVGFFLYFSKSNISNESNETTQKEPTKKIQKIVNSVTTNDDVVMSIEPITHIVNEQPNCIPIDVFTNRYEVTTVEKFFKENLLSESTVDSYLTTMSESQLILEAESGNVQSLFVLGMNYQWYSNHTTFQNPNLSLSDFDTNDKTLDMAILEKSREFLWLAAVNGIAIAVPELANTYSIEKNAKAHLGIDQSKLLLSELTHKILFYKVAPAVAKLSGFNNEELIAEYDEISSSTNTAYFNELFVKWSKARSEIGKNEMIELSIPEDVKDAYYKDFDICN